MCCGPKGGEAWRRRLGEKGIERGQCTWSQPPSFPSPLPGSPRLHRTPWLPGPPHPCDQPLQKQPRLGLRTPGLRLLVGMRMLLAQLAPPGLPRLSRCPLRLLRAAMTAPKAARRGVRVRERRRTLPRGEVGTRGRPGGLGRAGTLGADLLAGPHVRQPSGRGAHVVPGVFPARRGKTFTF